ncbi:hypothetical protein [Burkholderia ambifaria]|uniref:hypothetical protein n=1 Tax=Burkholderia ambifaria TaxID=152480 RepID=UPI00158B4D2E|nr:hypothetical protein [Burkholderia ambifaria]
MKKSTEEQLSEIFHGLVAIVGTLIVAAIIFIVVFLVSRIHLLTGGNKGAYASQA